jgi:hypothetical protein
MFTTDLLITLAATGAGGLFALLGWPQFRGWVKPNQLYGFRTNVTLRDDVAWYAANRVAGFWLIAAGIAIAGGAVATYLAGVAPLVRLFISLVTGLGGVIVMAVRADAASRKPELALSGPWQFRLLGLLMLTTLVSIGCGIARLPLPWEMKAGILWAYGICLLGISVPFWIQAKRVKP